MTATTARAGRERRHALLREFVTRYRVANQSELVALLEAEGVDATQATVSRDLDELDIAKQRTADGASAYALAEPLGLAQILRSFAVAIEASGNLAVVRTPPGSAGAVGGALDAAGLPDVLATVQGDDTLLVIAVEGSSGRAVADHLLALSGAPAPMPSRSKP